MGVFVRNIFQGICQICAQWEKLAMHDKFLMTLKFLVSSNAIIQWNVFLLNVSKWPQKGDSKTPVPESIYYYYFYYYYLYYYYYYYYYYLFIHLLIYLKLTLTTKNTRSQLTSTSHENWRQLRHKTVSKLINLINQWTILLQSLHRSFNAKKYKKRK